MKMRKRIISLVAGIAIIASLFTCFEFTASAKSYPSADEAVTVLNGLKIMDIKYDPDVEGIVTREEFAVFVADALGGIEAEGVRFVDVGNQNINKDKLNALFDMGIISGYERKFNPDAPITAEQAATIAMNAIGRSLYNSSFVQTDMYALARDLDVLPNGLSRQGNVSIGQAAQIIYQMMSVNTTQISGFKGGNAQMDNTGKTLFETYYNTRVIEGYVDGIYGTPLAKDMNLKKDEVSIGEEVYKLGYAVDTSTVLGLNMRVIYKTETDGEKTIIYMTPYRDYKQLVVEEDDYLRFDFDSYKLYYSVDGVREKYADIERNARFVYNGQYVKSDVKALMESIDGSYDNVKITIRETGSSKGYDLVIIERYVNYYITGLDTTNTVLLGKNAGVASSIDLNENNVKYVSIINASNESLTFDEMKTDAIASVFMSLDGEHCKILYSNSKINGFITAKDADDKSFTIGEITYKTDVAYWKTDGEKANTANGYVFYVDVYGKIAASEMDKTGSRLWGYLVNAYKDFENENQLVVKIFAQDGTMGKYGMAKKVKVDGISYKRSESDAIAKNLGDTEIKDGSTLPKAQLIRFTLNSEKEITWIDTINTTSAEEDNDAMAATEEPYKDAFFYSPNLKRFGWKTFVDDNTIFFQVPELDENGELINANKESIGREAKDSDYKVSSTNTYGNNTYFGIQGYVVDRSAAAQSVIVETKRFGRELTTSSSTLSVVKKKKPVVNSEGEVVTQLTVVTSGGEFDYTLPDENLAAKFNEGDLIELSADEQSVAYAGKRYYDYANDRLEGWALDYAYRNAPKYRQDCTITTGWVYRIENGIAMISHDASCETVDEVVDIGKLGVVVYDKSLRKNNVYTGSAGDITSFEQVGTNCSRIFVHTQSGVTLKTVIIYK